MTGNGQIATMPAAGMLPARARILRVEKARGTSDLRHRTAPGDGGNGWHGAPAPAREMSQSGTFEHGPLWYGPRLRPAFVAQVLGQIVTTGETCDPRSVAATYEEGGATGTATARLDRRI